jgi:hypothetical protein
MKTTCKTPARPKRFVKRAERVVDKIYPSYKIEIEENEEEPRAHRIPRSRANRDTKRSPKTQTKNTQTPGDPQRDPVVFFTYAPSTDTTGQVSDNAVDPSGANSEGGIIVRTGNWYVDASTDSGVTWKRFDRTALFPKTPGNGSTSDHLIHYIPSIDRFVWFMEHVAGNDGSGAFRLALASPADIKTDFTKAWRRRFSYVADDFGLKGVNFDFPDIAWTNEFLYLSTNTVSGATNGLLVARIRLSELAGSGNVTTEYTNPADSTDAYLGHLVQNSSDTMFWAGHTGGAKIRVHSWSDAGGLSTPTDVPVAVWPQNALSATSPNNTDWLTFLNASSQYTILGGVRVDSILWVAWTASSGKGPPSGFNFPNAHVRIVRIDLGTMKVAAEMQVWNPDYAFAYPSLHANARGEVGIVLAWGGKNDHANAAAGILGDFVVWYQNGSDTTTARWGDFTTVRRDSRNRSLFAGFGYYTRKDSKRASGYYFDTYYVCFGRQSAGP